MAASGRSWSAPGLRPGRDRLRRCSGSADQAGPSVVTNSPRPRPAAGRQGRPGGRDRPPGRGRRPGRADRGGGAELRISCPTRRLQCRKPEPAGPLGPVLLDQPPQLAINIRGLGSPFGLTNDGIEQGVGLYVDGVYYARPAAAFWTSSTSSVSRSCADRRERSTARTPRRARSTSQPRRLSSRRSTDVELTYGNHRLPPGQGHDDRPAH